MRSYQTPKSPWILLILLIAGGLIGSLLGSALGDILPILDKGFPAIGLAPATLNLFVISITLGVLIKLNVASIVGFLLALLVYFKI